MDDIIDSLPLPLEWSRHNTTSSQPSSSNQNPFAPNQESDDDASAAEPWPIPSAMEMQERRDFRRAIQQETEDHRRIHEHGGLGDTGRNILFCLADRERHGAMKLTRQQQPRRLRSSSSEQGGRSPSSVFESQSPVSTTQTLLEVVHNNGNSNQETPRSPDPADSKPSLPRHATYPLSVAHEIRTFGEYHSATKYQSSFLHHLGGDDVLDEERNRPPSSRAVSTISVAFAPDAQTMASTHGDHTVKISCCTTGRLLCSLEGHPRTPWTVKYHPKNSSMVASGCLGHQVRIWNWRTKTCLQMVRLEFAIISLSFHPEGNVLAVANGTRLHFWGIDDPDNTNTGGGNSNSDNNNNAPNRASQLTEMDQRHMLRCVHFPPDGKSLIIGGVNPEDPRRRTRGAGGMSFYLRLWDFDVETALQPYSDNVTVGTFMARRAISNPRTFVPRALLYNDGGFDVSPDGKTLCACAEYWLPDGVDNAMELLHREESAYMAEMEKAEEATLPSENISSPTNSAAVSKRANAGGDARERLTPTRSPTRRSIIRPSMPQTPMLPRTPTAEAPSLDFLPRTPDYPAPNQNTRLSPPSPPGRRFAGGLRQGGRATVTTTGGAPLPSSGSNADERGLSTPPPPPPPPPPAAPAGHISRPPHPLTVLSNTTDAASKRGRYVPHVVLVSLDTTPIPREIDTSSYGKVLGAVAKGHQPRLGQLMEACPLDTTKAAAVTCVKFSPSADYCLIGYGVREPVVEGGSQFHPVTAIYRICGGMTHVSTMLSGDDDVNIARFHPEPGHGFVYGTKQGRVRVLAPRPWTYYNC